jgi:hypothetical protein
MCRKQRDAGSFISREICASYSESLSAPKVLWGAGKLWVVSGGSYYVKLNVKLEV